MARTRKTEPPPPPPAPPADDFDASTPPPRRTPPPTAGPIPAWVELPLNEPVAAVFLDWAASGRVPAGSVLCEQVGTLCGIERHSGYRVAAASDGPGGRALGKTGTVIPTSALDSYRVAVVVKEKNHPAARFVVMSPKEGR